MNEGKRAFVEPQITKAEDNEETIRLEQGLKEFLKRTHEMHRITMFKIFDLVAAGVKEKTLRALKDRIGEHCREALLRLYFDMNNANLIVGNCEDEYGVKINENLFLGDSGNTIDLDLPKMVNRHYLQGEDSLAHELTLFGEYTFGSKAAHIAHTYGDGSAEIESILSPRAQYFSKSVVKIIQSQMADYLRFLNDSGILEDGEFNKLIRIREDNDVIG